MPTFTRYKTPAVLFEKINELYGLLRRSKSEYEQMAATLPDKELSRTMLTLAQESNQYACELSSQLQILRGAVQAEEPPEPTAKIDAKLFRHTKAIVRFCERSEKKTIRAYQKLLAKTYLHEGVRKMISYQLEGLQSAFEQLKLLNSLKFH